MAKDKATKDGLVVNPPSLGNLPGEGDVTYASQVKDVLISYTTREDTYEYYEERNYVNDINREHTEVLQTYDHDLKARETYSYGYGRNSYLNNQTGHDYQYLTNQAGSVTGLTKDGALAASSSYKLYGSTKTTTDETGNPYAYNGEARDGTGLDYLRARYYDSVAGTFLTEDIYQGQETDPLSQNRYAYVRNNPVNYTDPSGHFWKGLIKGAKKAWNGVKKAASNAWNTVKTVASNTWNAVKSAASHAVNWVSNKVSQAANWVGNQVNKAKNWVVQQWNNFQQAAHQTYQSARHYVAQQQAQAQAQAEARRQQHIRDEYTQATGLNTTPKTREGGNLFRNWGKALQKMYKHVCTTADRIGKQGANFLKKVDWKKVLVTAGAIGVGIALTVATGGLGALTGFVGGQFVGAGASVATNLTQNIGNQTVRQVAKVGIQAGVDTAIDTGLDVAAGNKVTGQTLAMNFGYNLFTNGLGSISTKKAPKSDVSKSKPMTGEVLDAGYVHNRPVKDVTPTKSSSQKLIGGPDPSVARIGEPGKSPDFYVNPSGDVIPATSPYSYLQDSKHVGAGKDFTAAQKRPIIDENMARNGGVVRSDLSGEILYKPQKSQKGVTPDPNEWQIDHIIPKSKGGSNSYANAQVLSRYENRVKSDNYSGGD